MDTFSAEDRSAVMRRVHSKNTRPEIKLRSALHRAGFRFRLHVSSLPGEPDIVLPKYKTVIFVHGCFWHGHECKRGNRLPTTNAEYWRNKIERNRTRDMMQAEALARLGWTRIVVWECEIRDGAVACQCVNDLLKS